MTELHKIDVTLNVLLKAREFLSNPDNWHKGSISDVGERRFCVLGSVVHVAKTRDEKQVGMHEAWDLLENLADRMGWKGPGLCSAAQFNDAPDTTHADLMRFVDRAIALRCDQIAAVAA